MEHHNLFGIFSAFFLGAGIGFAFLIGWAAAPFFLFALAAALRGASLKKGHFGLRNAAYVVFLLGIILAGYYMYMYAALQ